MYSSSHFVCVCVCVCVCVVFVSQEEISVKLSNFDQSSQLTLQAQQWYDQYVISEQFVFKQDSINTGFCTLGQLQNI